MPLFTRKENVSPEAYWAPRLDDILSDESEAKAQRLRQRHGDPAIQAADASIWACHLRAARVELAAVSLALSQEADAAEEATEVLFDLLQERAPDLIVLCDLYDRAFGDEAVDGVMAMTHIFDAAVTGGRMLPQTVSWLQEGFDAELRERDSEWKRLRLTLA